MSLVCTGLLLGGCALPNPFAPGDVLLGYGAVAPQGRAARRVVVGVDLRVHEPWGGLEVGFSDRTLLPVADDGDAGAPLALPSQLPWPLCWTWTDAQGVSHAFGLVLFPSPPNGSAFVHASTFGFGVTASAHENSVHVGYANVTGAAVPAQESALYAIAYDSDDWPSSHFVQFREGTRP
jgi:hypothetical protein